MRKCTLLFLAVLVVSFITSCSETLPTVDFQYAIDKSSPLTVRFSTNELSSDYGTISYAWDFGDGSLIDTTAEPTHTYKERGDYDVKLVVKSSKSFINGVEKVKTVPVQIDIKNFDFTVSSNPIAPLQVTYEARGDFDGNISFEWDFGNGKTATGKNVTITYLEASLYKVTLTAKISDTTYRQSITKDVDLKLDIKTLDFTYNPDPFDPLNVQLTAVATASTTVNPASIEYIWDFGFGNIKRGKTVVHKFSNVGYFDVQLTASVVDTEITKVINRSINTSLYINNADFTYGSDPESPLEVIFSGAGNSPSGEVEFEFDFGNGVKLRTQNAKYRFTKFGEFVVSMKVSVSGTNVSQVVTKTIKINPPEIDNLDFTYEQSKTNPLQFYLVANGTSSFGTLTYEWDFGFGKKVTGKSTLVEFDDYGSNLVNLTVKVKDTPAEQVLSKVITIPAPKISSLSFSRQVHPKNPLQMIFTANALVEGQVAYDIDYVWKFGDGRSASGEEVNYTYEYYDTYNITLKATLRGTKISSTYNQYVDIAKDIVIDFDCYNTKDDIDDIIYLCRPYISPNSGIKNPTYSWNFGDPDSKEDNEATGKEPTHKFTKLSKFAVTLTVDDATLREPKSVTRYIYVLVTPNVGRSFAYRVSKPDTFGGERDIYVSLAVGDMCVNDPSACYSSIYRNIDRDKIDVIVTPTGSLGGNSTVPIQSGSQLYNPSAYGVQPGELLFYHRKGTPGSLDINIKYRFKDSEVIPDKNGVRPEISSEGVGRQSWSGK